MMEPDPAAWGGNFPGPPRDTPVAFSTEIYGYR
jgi:hypothetical protein